MEPILEEATIEDYDGILDISDGVYFGFDYLPFILEKWLTYPENRINLVLKDKNSGEILGFESMFNQKNIGYVLKQGVRIGSKFRGKNFGQLLLNLGEKYLIEKKFGKYLGNVMYEKYAPPKIFNDNKRFGDVSGYYCFFVAIIEKQLSLKLNNTMTSQTINLENLIKLLRKNPKTRKIFLKNDFLVLDWVPYHIDCLEDIKYHINNIRIVVDNENDPKSMGILTEMFPCSLGYRVVLDLFSSDFETLKIVLQNQLNYLGKQFPNDVWPGSEKSVGIQFFADSKISSDVFKYIFDELKIGTLWKTTDLKPDKSFYRAVHMYKPLY